MDAFRTCASTIIRTNSSNDTSVVRMVLLEDHPDPPHKVARVPPVPSCVEVSQGEFLLPAGRDLRSSPGDLLRHEMIRMSRRLVVVGDSACDEHAVPASIEPGEEAGGEFAYTVRSNGVVRGPFVLGGIPGGRRKSPTRMPGRSGRTGSGS